MATRKLVERLMNCDISAYEALIQQFISGAIDVYQFETAYLAIYKADKQMFDEPVYLILNQLFSDVDCFTDDEPLIAENPNFNISRDELFRQAKHAYAELSKLQNAR